MTILGIDYGRRKLGLAFSTGSLATPYRVLLITSWQDAFEKVAKIARTEKLERVVVGVSEREMAQEQKAFAAGLRRTTGIQTEVWDETLTTKEAQILAREAGIRPKRLRELEDAFAACLMLQSYLEAHGKT